MSQTAEFQRGWRVLLVGLIGVTTSAGVLPLYSFGPFIQPLQSEFGWSRGEIYATLTFFFISLVLGFQLAGVLLERFTVRRVALGSLVAYSAAYFLLSRLDGSLGSLYLSYLLLSIAGAGTLQVTWTMIVNLWFVRHRGLALAIVLSGTGLCSLLVIPFLAWVMEAQGWRAGFMALGLVPLLLALPLVYLWLPAGAPQQKSLDSQPLISAGLELRVVVRSYRFWVLLGGLNLVVIGILGMVTSIVPLLGDNGLSLETTASVYSVVGLANVVGRVLTGWLVDRWWAPGVAFVMLTLPAFGCLIFGVIDGRIALLMLAAALIGLGAGAEYDVAAFLTARYFGMRDYGRIFAAQAAIGGVGVASAPAVFGWLYDSTGSYDAMLWICGSGFVIGPALLLTLGAYPEYEAPASRDASGENERRRAEVTGPVGSPSGALTREP